jgi:hypothetical protein
MRRAGGPGPTAANSGYAAVDALIALLILSLTIILSLEAFQVAARTARMAAEAEAARTLLARLIDGEPKDLSGSAGTTTGFAWTVRTEPTASNALIDVCRRAANLVARRSGRHYGTVTLVTCPPRTGA